MKKSGIYIFIIALYGTCFSQSGVGIGITVPDSSAILHIQNDSDPKGLLIPRYSEADRDNINSAGDGPAEGLIIYNTEDSVFNYYDGKDWLTLIPSPAKLHLDMNNYEIRNLQDGDADGDAVNYGQLTDVDDDNLDRDGSQTMTGNLNMNNLEIQNLQDGEADGDAVNYGQLKAVDDKLPIIEDKIPDVFFQTFDQNTEYPGEAGESYFWSLADGNTTYFQATNVSNSSSRTKSYLCMAFFHLGGSGESEDIGIALYKGDEMFASWRRWIRESSGTGEDLYSITGIFSLDPGETTSIYNRLYLFDDDIRYRGRGMFVIGSN